MLNFNNAIFWKKSGIHLLCHCHIYFWQSKTLFDWNKSSWHLNTWYSSRTYLEFMACMYFITSFCSCVDCETNKLRWMRVRCISLFDGISFPEMKKKSLQKQKVMEKMKNRTVSAMLCIWLDWNRIVYFELILQILNSDRYFSQLKWLKVLSSLYTTRQLPFHCSTRRNC